jgi:hypothetical protein
VCDTLYPKKPKKKKSTASQRFNKRSTATIDLLDDSDSQSEEEGDNITIDINIESELSTIIVPEVPGENDGPELLDPTCLPLVEKTREKVKEFKNSPMKYETYLEDLIVKAHGKRFNLILDMKVRWNSLIAMIRRFLLLKDELKLATLMMNKAWTFTTEDIEKLSNLLKALEPLEVAIEMLGARKTNLLDAELIYKTIYEDLDKQTSDIAKRLKNAFRSRVADRRDKNLIHLMSFLENPSSWNRERDFFGENVNQAEIKKLATDLCCRLFPDSVVHPHGYQVDEDGDVSCFEDTEFEKKDLHNEAFISIKDRLTKILNESKNINDPKPINGQASISDEMNNFAMNPRKMPTILLKLFRALKTIPPTSVESERCFSTCGIYVTKMRTSLNDDSINSLIFLKKYYKEKENEMEEARLKSVQSQIPLKAPKVDTSREEETFVDEDETQIILK